MGKHFLSISLVLLAINAYSLPAPSTLKERDKRLNAATPTPTPRQQIVQTPEAASPQTRSSIPRQQILQAPQAPQTRSSIPRQQAPQTRTAPIPTTRAVAPQGPRPSTTVVVDAGHGGHDRGGIAGQRVDEKTMNLDVAQRLKAVLQSYGYRVVMTRDSDVFIPLGTRVAIANSYRDAIFVCVHFNATPRRSASGVETYFYSSQSLPLASAIHYYLNRVAPTPNRGVRRRGFYVLRRTTVPSVLVECGFLTNPTEAQYAQSVSYRQQLAEAIARGVRERSMVAGSSSRLAANSATVPFQPFIDQTHYRDPDLARSKHRRSKSSSRSTSSKRKRASDDSGTATKSSTKKKKSSSAKTEG